MAGFSDFTENAILNSLFGKTSAFGAFATGPTLYVALCTAAPTDAQTGTTIPEATYTGYARKLTAATDWNAAAAGVVDNAVVISFPQNTGVDQTVTHFALVDAASGGNLISFGTLTAAHNVAGGSTPQFAIGVLDNSLD